MDGPRTGFPFVICPESLVLPAVVINEEDDLVLTVWDLAGTTNIVGQARILTPGGPVYTMNFEAAPGGSGGATVKRFSIPAGYLLDITLSTDASNIIRGQVFAELSLGPPTSQADIRVKHTVLVSGYIVSGLHLAWPGNISESPLSGSGHIQSFAWADPAAGSEVSNTMSYGSRYVLRSLQFTLVTSAAVATRQVHLVIDDGTNVLVDIASSTTQTASLTKTYYWAPFAYNMGTVLNNIYNPIPSPLYLMGGWRVRTVTDNKDAADNYGAPQCCVERWIEPSS